MIELKRFDIVGKYCDEETMTEYTPDGECYYADEVDKVIAGLEEGERHHKYKRCLSIAGRCFTKSNYHFILARHGEDVKENTRRCVLYSKWRMRWMELAKKFKDK